VFERFTEYARQVVVVAQREASDMRHNYIGTEHLLLGLLFDQDQIADRVLRSFGLTVEGVRERVVAVVGFGEEPTAGQIPFTPRAKKVLELGLREASSPGHNHIDTEHLLLGLLREHEGVAFRILRVDYDVELDAVRQAVLGLVSGPDPQGVVSEPRAVPVAGQVPPLRIGFMVTPDAHARRLLMSAGARALADGRTEFRLRDLLAALRSDQDAARLMAELAADESGEETREDAPPEAPEA
jgi:hypothetical protein